MKNQIGIIVSFLFCVCAQVAFAEPPLGIAGDVTVMNEASNPVPVTVQGEVSSAEPEFYRVSRTPHGTGDDKRKRVPVTERLLLHNLTAQTTGNNDAAGCFVRVSIQEGGEGGPFTLLFEIRHHDKDSTKYGDGQTTQQRLGRGVVVEPGDDIVIEGSHFTSDADFPNAGPNVFCSSTVQVYGEVLSE